MASSTTRRGAFSSSTTCSRTAPRRPWLGWWTFSGEHPVNAYDHAKPPGYAAWANLHALPKFNTDNAQVREYLMRVGEYWVRRGIDGWRLDSA